jgi:type II secretory pathway component GspD/PulD (secretin)
MRLLFSLLAFLPFFAFAQSDTSVNLDFRRLPVVEFVDAFYGTIIKRNYVITPDALSNERVISMNISASAKQLPLLVSEVLSVAGLSVREVGGIFYIDGLNSGNSVLSNEFEVYMPRFRSAGYLRNLLTAVDNRGSVMSAPVLSTGNMSFQGTESVSSSTSSIVDDLVVLSGSSEHIARLRDFLAKVDVPPLSVEVRAALIEVSSSDNDNFSIGAAIRAFSEKFSFSIGSASASGGSYVRLSSTSVDALLHLMREDVRYRIVTQPRLLVLDGKKGRLSVGSDVPTRGAVSYDDSGNAIQSIEYRSSGVILDVSPLIYRDRVSLTLHQQVSNFAETTSSGIDSPTLIKRELETVLDVSEGDVIVMAGLDESKGSNSGSSLSFLPFGLSRSKSRSNVELMLLLEVRRVAVEVPGNVSD